MRVEVTVMVEIPPLYFPFEVNWFFLVHDDVYVKVRDANGNSGNNKFAWLRTLLSWDTILQGSPQ